MKVSELIDKLKLLDQDARILVSACAYDHIHEMESAQFKQSHINKEYEYYFDEWDANWLGITEEELSNIRKKFDKCIIMEITP